MDCGERSGRACGDLACERVTYLFLLNRLIDEEGRPERGLLGDL